MEKVTSIYSCESTLQLTKYKKTIINCIIIIKIYTRLYFYSYIKINHHSNSKSCAV